jgi:hypothetical protein
MAMLKVIFAVLVFTMSAAFMVVSLSLSIGLFVGWAWWMWLAIQIGSFWMFIVGIAGPSAFPAGALGLWCLVFGMPAWLLHLVTVPATFPT